MVGRIISTENELNDFLVEASERLLRFKSEYASRSRVNRFLRALEILEASSAQIVSQVIEETGKHLNLANAEFDAAISFARQTAFKCFSSSGDVIKSVSQDKYVNVDRVPLGPSVLITSYNTPMPNLFWKLSPSYLAGNSSLVCPSPFVAKSAQMAIECLYGAGISPAEVAVTNGDPALADFACKSPEVKLVSFTGSNLVGKIISSNTAPNHPKLVLELGGTNPLIVLESARLDQAARAALLSAFSNGGQRCAAGSIAIVQESTYERFLAAVDESLEDLEFQRSLRDANTPLISQAGVKAHDSFLREESTRGTKVIQLRDLAAGQSSIPALLSNSPDPLSSSSKELFSPVLRLVAARDRHEALSFANKLPLRLTSAVWTEQLSDFNFFRDHLNFGLINFNGPTFGAEPNFPFGGMGGSGNGSRDAGFNALETYSQTRVWTLVS